MILAIFQIFLALQQVNGFVFSCNEVHHMINSGPQVSTEFACIVLQEDYHHMPMLRNIYIVHDNVSVSFADLATIPGNCIKREHDGVMWNIISHQPNELICDFESEFSLIFTSSQPSFIPVKNIERDLGISTRIFTSPRGGMIIGTKGCCGRGNITWFSGAGRGEEEKRFRLHSWRCADLPKWIVSFDNVVTIVADAGMVYYFSFSTDYLIDTPLQQGERAAILSSGKSDNLQNAKPFQNSAAFSISDGPTTISARGWSIINDNFEEEFTSCFQFVIERDGSNEYDALIRGQIDKSYDNVNCIKLQYGCSLITPEEIGSNQDSFVVELTVEEPTLLEQVTTRASDPTPK
ncbi:hypothetical protein PFISCL1PPCAC_14488, partial [Pristionchus fissidentatus]